MVVYTPDITPRIAYIFRILLPAIGIQNFYFAKSKEAYLEESGAAINYSASSIKEKELHIVPGRLLLEDDIREQEIHVFPSAIGYPGFYATSGDIDFDVFAASFYLITRYEEYLPHQKDQYGRFDHKESLAFRNGFLQQPMVNLWLLILKRQLLNIYPSLELNPPSFRLVPTYDVDIAYDYKGKGLIRNAVGAVRDILSAKLNHLSSRTATSLGRKKDPFDVFDWLHTLNSKTSEEAIYFILAAAKRSLYDKNISPESPVIKDLLRYLSSSAIIGLHPSWQSNNDMQLLKEEKSAVEKAVEKSIQKSRQHYLVFRLPETFEKLIELDIQDEYSMGYGTINGFRASFCLPYPWFNLKQNTTTALMLHPFCFMDANAIFEEKLTPDEAIEQLRNYLQVCKMVNGEMVVIFHNHFLSEKAEWKKWRRVPEVIYQGTITDFI